MNFPASATWANLALGSLVIQREDADPTDAVGVWPDGEMRYFIVADSIWLAIYDRSLDTTPPSGAGWRKVELTA